MLALFAFLFIIAIEVPGLVKKRMWRELAAFAVILWVGMSLSILQILGVELPSPITFIEAFYKPLAEWLKPP
ncbi:MAG: hypothetical protein AB1556_01115 [Bacillota bacterium]